VDTIRTEIKILEPLSDASALAQPTMDLVEEETPAPDDAHVTNLNYRSTQPKSSTPQRKNMPVKPTIPPPMRQASEKPASEYAAAAESWGDSDVPPPPDNFPDDWDTQWQPSFEEASLAERPEPKAESKSVELPPAKEPEIAPIQIEPERPEPQEIVREAIAFQTMKIETAQTQIPPSIYVPLAKEDKDKEHPPQQITMILRSTGEKDHDRRRIKTIYGTLISFHGKDRFSFQIFENGSGYLIDFPNDTTRVCPEMLERLKKLIGEESWRVEEITFQ
jgi:hypothetical protein